MQACLVVHLPIILIVACPKFIIEHFLAIDPHSFLHVKPFFMCWKKLASMTLVDILFTLSLWFPIDYGSILLSVTMCLLFFALIRAMVSPCFQFGYLNFLACNLWLSQSFYWRIFSLLCYIFFMEKNLAISFCKFPLKLTLWTISVSSLFSIFIFLFVPSIENLTSYICIVFQVWRWSWRRILSHWEALINPQWALFGALFGPFLGVSHGYVLFAACVLHHKNK